MPLTTVIASKEGPYQPILLATFTFPDGTLLRASTHNLNAAEGGNQYSGNDYLARIDEQDIAQIQARSEQGIDRSSDVTIHLINADQVILNDYEMGAGKGFKGAILKLVIVLADIDRTTGQYVFSTDSPAPVKFQGICDAGMGGQGAAIISVKATTSHNLAKVDFPILHVQQRCINVFPRNAFERLAGGTDMSSWWWGCGYNPDQVGTDPEIGGDCRRGNYQTGTTPFTTCNYTKSDCVARGMYSLDSGAKRTGRFTAIQWAPLNRAQQSRQYSSGKWVTVFSGRNDSIYSRSYPMLYGTQWIKQPIIANIIGDANSTRMEVVVCVGDVGADGILQVLVNGVVVPPLGSVSPIPGAGSDPLFRWNFLDQKVLTSTHTGSRNGYANTDNGWNGNGDPYGGLATIEIVVYAELAQSNSVPDVQVLCAGPKVKVPNTASVADQATWPYERTTIAPWHTLDLLVWGNYTYAEIDLQTFIDEAAYSAASVSYTDLAGNSASHGRFISEFALEQRRKGNEVLQAHLRSYNAQLVPNSETGLLQLFIRKTLADQQPSAVPGSNYATAIASVHADGTTGSGYPAYLIDESVIQQDGQGNLRVRGPYSLPNAQAPNRITIPFQDRDNQYADDSIAVTDVDDVSRAAGYQLGGQAIEANAPILGISSFDQGTRAGNVLLAEGIRGNESADTRGSRFWDVDTTHRLEHLRVGQIVLFRYQANQLQPSTQLQSPPGTPITGILCRVEAIKPTTNYSRMTVTLRWHEDVWYTDAYGQHAAPLASDPAKSLPSRPPYPWRPYAEQPVAGDSMVDTSEWNFAIAQSYGQAADGTPIATLSVAGNPPLNQPSSDIQPPLVGLQGTTANTGGSIAGGQRVYGAIAVKDSSGKWSLASRLFAVDVPTGTNTNTVTTPTIRWPASVAAWILLAGPDEQRLCEQATATGTTPATITITALNVATYGPPDILADSLVYQVKRVFHGGVWGDACTAVASNGDGTGTITFATATTTHQFLQTSSTDGYDLSLLARPQADTGNVPITDFHVIDNTGGVYHVSPDPVAVGLSTAGGYVFEMRARPSTFSATTIGDANLANAYNSGAGLTANAEAGRRVRIIKGAGRGQERTIVSNTSTVLTVDVPWDTLPGGPTYGVDATSRFIIEDASWQPASSAKISTAALTTSPAPASGSFSTDNYRQQTVLVQALVADANGNTSLARFSPFREIYIWGAQGTRTITASTTQLPTDGLVLCDTSGITQPAATTLAAAVTSTAQTNITLTSGASTVNGTDILIGTERMRIQSGGGTANLVVSRGAAGTTPTTYVNGTAVIIPGALTFTCLAAASVPNAKLTVKKTTSDINYVVVLAGGSDTFDSGATALILADNTDSAGLAYVQFPG